MGSIRPSEKTRVREELLDRFMIVRNTTGKICKPLSHEDFVICSTEDTSPPKWHLAHTTWFFENFILVRNKRGYEPFKPEFHFLFNSYYRRAGSYLPKAKRGIISRPTIDEVFQYRQIVTEAVYNFMSSINDTEFEKISKVFEIGINHEEQHQELLLMDIKRNLFENPIRPHYQNNSPLTPSYMGSEAQWLNVASGLARIGVEKSSRDFSFDNEKDAHSHWIESCMISSHLVTNDEYLAFIDEGGYENPLLWLSDGWDFKEKEKWQHPLYWEKEGQAWWTMTLSGMSPLDLAAPVSHISYYEAQAFAHWRGCRLPTEYEWESAALTEHNYSLFLEDGELEPLPPDDDHDFYSQMHGTLWEWTQSAYLPYPRYEKFQHGLAEYNEKFMCNQFVLRGGSCLTPRKHYRPTYRNFYYPHMRWQYSGIRLAKDLA
ncbi:MAG TPA: ergothioneine biosynthesis protein EgtB [Bacteriovoracaceae bacterium]|nr:ergothioneine biosynthesis protein EgtB [Bacteriovoracaceae bacterium]